MSKETKKQFYTDGLLWLVNTAILHPRGYALSYDPKTTKLDIINWGEYSIFKPHKSFPHVKKYELAESKRERKYNAK